jgi:hypothetical protein
MNDDPPCPPAPKQQRFPTPPYLSSLRTVKNKTAPYQRLVSSTMLLVLALVLLSVLLIHFVVRLP